MDLSKSHEREPVEPAGPGKSFNRPLRPDEDLSPDALRLLDQMGREDERRLSRGLKRAELRDALAASRARSKEEARLQRELRKKLDELLN